jgi:hypothetical protein
MNRNHLAPFLSMAVLSSACVFHKDLGGLDTDGAASNADGGDDGSAGASMTAAGDEGDASGSEDAGGHDSTGDGGTAPGAADGVDILFVVDNSGFMADEQGRLAASISDLTEPLEQAGVPYRIAVTSTDNGTSFCEGITSEHGAFVMTSCQERLQEFYFQGEEAVDGTDIACQDQCGLPTLDLLPTATASDPNPVARPWVEWNGPDDLNTPGLAPSTVLACALPTGINGCGFEQPLESMLLALERSNDPDEAEYGFLRSDAHLLVVFVGDEDDCSHNPEHDTIFDPDGERTFWTDPEASFPNSAVCWNAGVQCVGTSPYPTCVPVDLAPDGTPAATADDASLRPISRYVELLQGIEASKTAGRVHVMALAGRSTEQGPFVYEHSGVDAEFEHDFGISAGCTGSGGPAVPPVRIRAVVNAMSDAPDAGIFSVCEADYGPVLSQIADTILSWAE